MLNALADAITLAGHTVDVYRSTVLKTDTGGSRSVVAAFATDVVCCVTNLSRNAREKWAKRSIDVTHVVYFNADPSINCEDKLLWKEKYMVVVDVENVEKKDILWQVACRWQE